MSDSLWHSYSKKSKNQMIVASIEKKRIGCLVFERRFIKIQDQFGLFGGREPSFAFFIVSTGM